MDGGTPVGRSEGRFAGLAAHPRIIVSGPHRSGTTICATMIAHDTGFRLLREEETANDEGRQCWPRFCELIMATRIVVQAPFFAHALHYLPVPALIVMMRRPLEDISRSERRMHTAEGAPCGAGISQYRVQKFHGEHTAGIVYETWAEQKRRTREWMEVEYESLRSHPLWIDERAHFHHRQTG